MKRKDIDEICLGDKFKRQGIVFTVQRFHGITSVFIEGATDEDDTYTFRDDKLLKEINEYE